MQDEAVYEEYKNTGSSYLKERQQKFIDKYKLNEHERWDWYQDDGLLVFSHDGKRQVGAQIHFSGSYSTKSGTWMWAWGNDSLAEKVKASSRKIQNIGLEKHVMKLASAHWKAEEEDGWEMTAILAKELNAIVAYRTPNQNGYVYMAVTKVKWVNKNKLLQLFG